MYTVNKKKGEQVMIKKGFTLAEVLITLSILGVVAALTIPGLIANTQGRQYSVGYKKALATFGSAINKSVAMDGVDLSNWNTAQRTDTAAATAKYPTGRFEEFMRSNFNVAKVDANNNVFLADGTEFVGIGAFVGTCTGARPCFVTVDTNGDAGPNTQTTMIAGKPKVTDRFIMVLTDVAALPAAQLANLRDPDTGLAPTASTAIGGQAAPSAIQVQATNFAITGKI